MAYHSAGLTLPICLSIFQNEFLYFTAITTKTIRASFKIFQKWFTNIENEWKTFSKSTPQIFMVSKKKTQHAYVFLFKTVTCPSFALLETATHAQKLNITLVGYISTFQNFQKFKTPSLLYIITLHCTKLWANMKHYQKNKANSLVMDWRPVQGVPLPFAWRKLG